MLFQLLIFAVDGQEILGSGQGEHQLLLFLTGVAGDMDVVHALIDDFCAQQEQTVDDLGHALLVAGDGLGRDDDEVAGADAHLTVAAGSHAAQGAQRLALTAGGHQHHLFRRILVYLIDADEGAFRDVHIAQLLSHGGIVDHAAAAEGHLAAILHGEVDDLLDAVDVGREGRNDDALVLRPGKQAADTGGHLLLGGGEAGTLRVGGVAQQSQHALLTVLRQSRKVGGAAGQRGVVDLEVAGLDDGAGRAVDGESYRVRDGVVHMDGLHGEAAQLELLAGGDLHELGLACQAELFQLIADEAAGQAGAVDGQIELLQQVGDAADVVLMAVGDEQALDLILILHHKGEVGDDHIDAEHIIVGENEAAVHDDHIAAALIDRHVLAYFAEAAQRIDMDGRCSLFGLLGAAGPAGVVGAAGSAGALFAGRIGRSGSVVLFFCLCHRKPPKIQSAKHRSAPEDSLPCIKGSIKTHLLPSDASYRNHFISVVLYHAAGSAGSLLPIQSICSMRPRRFGRNAVSAPTARPYTHFVATSIVFLASFVNSKLGPGGGKLCPSP